MGKDQLQHTVMIGNSLRSDIYPSLTLGMKAIHIERATWAYDAFTVDKTNADYFSSTLEFVPKTIEQLQN